MKKHKLKKKLKKNNQHYSNTIRHSGERSDSRIMVQNNDSGQAGMTINNVLLFLFILLLPTQLGKHFFLDFSYLSGVRVDYLAPVIYLTDIIALVLFSLNFRSLINFFVKKKVLIIISLLFINVLMAKFDPLSIYRYVKFLEIFGVIYIFKQSKISAKYVLSGLLIGAIFQLFLATSQFINKHSLQGIFYFFGERSLNLSMPGIAKASLNGVEILRPYGTFSHPNSMAGFYLLIYFFVLTKFRQIPTDLPAEALAKVGSKWFKLISTILLLICSLLIFISFSKIAIITFLIFNFIYLWGSPLKQSCKFCFFARTFILLIVSLVFLQAKSDPLSLPKRLQLMDDSRVIIRQQPVFGTGLGKYLIAQQKFPQLFADFLNQPVHNIFLLFLAEVGLITGIIIFILLFKELRAAIIKYPYIFAILLITGLFDHYWLTLQQNYLLIGVILGLLL